MPHTLSRLALTLSLIFFSICFTNISMAKPKQLIGVFKVIDGSGLSIDGKTYRLAGLQGPTSRQKCKKGALPWLCGAAAKKFLNKKVDGLILRCGLQEANKIQCFLKGRDLSVIIIKAGWAVSTIKNDTYKQAERHAQRNGLGLWPKIK